tara:strand:+ start:49 stop:426 length:378 start_codon:yes stop_codon:yes gene_type:complete
MEELKVNKEKLTELLTTIIDKIDNMDNKITNLDDKYTLLYGKLDKLSESLKTNSVSSGFSKPKSITFKKNKENLFELANIITNERSKAFVLNITNNAYPTITQGQLDAMEEIGLQHGFTDKLILA